MISRATALARAISLPTSSPSQRSAHSADRPARVDRDQPSAIADATQEVVEEDRMGLAGVAAPEDDQIGLLGLTV